MYHNNLYNNPYRNFKGQEKYDSELPIKSFNQNTDCIFTDWGKCEAINITNQTTTKKPEAIPEKIPRHYNDITIHSNNNRNQISNTGEYDRQVGKYDKQASKELGYEGVNYGGKKYSEKYLWEKIYGSLKK